MKNKILALALLSTFANISINAADDDIDSLIASMSSPSKKVEPKDLSASQSLSASLTPTPKQPSLSRSIFGAPKMSVGDSSTSGAVANQSPVKLNPQQQKIKDLETEVLRLQKAEQQASEKANKATEAAEAELKQKLLEAKDLYEVEAKKLQEQHQKLTKAIADQLSHAQDDVKDLQKQLKTSQKATKKASEEKDSLEAKKNLEINGLMAKLKSAEDEVARLNKDLKDETEKFSKAYDELKSQAKAKINGLSEELRKANEEIVTLKSSSTANPQVQRELDEANEQLQKKDQLLVKMKQALLDGKLAKENAEAAEAHAEQGRLLAIDSFKALQTETAFILKLFASYVAGGEVDDDDVITTLHKQNIDIGGTTVTVEISDELAALLKKTY